MIAYEKKISIWNHCINCYYCSFTSVVGIKNTDAFEKKESPLFKIRTVKAIKQTKLEPKKLIEMNFFANRIFFLPIPLLINKNKGNGEGATIFSDIPCSCACPFTSCAPNTICNKCTAACK